MPLKYGGVMVLFLCINPFLTLKLIDSTYLVPEFNALIMGTILTNYKPDTSYEIFKKAAKHFYSCYATVCTVLFFNAYSCRDATGQKW